MGVCAREFIYKMHALTLMSQEIALTSNPFKVNHLGINAHRIFNNKLTFHNDMSNRQTYRVQSSAGEQYVTLVLFSEVKNAPKLRSDVTNGTISAAMLDPTLVCWLCST